MPRPTLRTGALLLALLTPGCRTAHQSSPNESAVSPASEFLPRVERKRDLLSVEEIRAIAAPNAYDAILRLRPEFFGRRKGQYVDIDAPSPNRSGIENAARPDEQSPTVFLNGTEQGGPATLRTIPASAIVQIRYYREMYVPTRYGMNHPRGVIDVRTTP